MTYIILHVSYFLGYLGLVCSISPAIHIKAFLEIACPICTFLMDSTAVPGSILVLLTTRVLPFLGNELVLPGEVSTRCAHPSTEFQPCHRDSAVFCDMNKGQTSKCGLQGVRSALEHCSLRNGLMSFS